ncbi:WbqC family protein [Candidatus Bathyarchaeota archaeon]|nr:WbqC family protein [Candidatus Bathyarchaeota archaeon]
MKIAIHQPNYIPYPGFFAKLALSDVFVIYDTAQFTRGDFINRNRIRGFAPNEYIWLTLPVGKRNFKGIAINQIEIAKDKVFKNHSKTIRSMYSKAPFFDDEVCQCIATPHKNLADHNVFIIHFLVEKLRLRHPEIVLSSRLDISGKHGTEGILEITKALGGDEYVSGAGGKAYLEEHLFKKESIKLSFLNYQTLRYKQIQQGFLENMSIVDPIFNMGWKQTGEAISSRDCGS